MECPTLRARLVQLHNDLRGRQCRTTLLPAELLVELYFPRQRDGTACSMQGRGSSISQYRVQDMGYPLCLLLLSLKVIVCTQWQDTLVFLCAAALLTSHPFDNFIDRICHPEQHSTGI
ncbi:unnamed protein product [Eretmochelys imbricata]